MLTGAQQHAAHRFAKSLLALGDDALIDTYHQAALGIERPLENQVRQRDRRLERVADHILQHPVPFEPTRYAEFAGTLWVDGNQHAELFGLGPERMKFGIR